MTISPICRSSASRSSNSFLNRFVPDELLDLIERESAMDKDSRVHYMADLRVHTSLHVPAWGSLMQLDLLVPFATYNSSSLSTEPDRLLRPRKLVIFHKLSHLMHNPFCFFFGAVNDSTGQLSWKRGSCPYRMILE